MNSSQIEKAVANYYGWRQNVIVPNVSWGFGISYEMDLLVITKAGYGIEVEIKTSMADLKRDKLKRSWHDSKKIKALYFAVPEKFGDISEHIPAHAGILHIPEEGRYWLSVFKQAVYMKADPLSLEQRLNICRLGCMRIWNLKRTIDILSQKLECPKELCSEWVCKTKICRASICLRRGDWANIPDNYNPVTCLIRKEEGVKVNA